MSTQKTRREVVERAQAVTDALVSAGLPIDRTSAVAMMLAAMTLLRADGVETGELGGLCTALVRVTASGVPKGAA